MKQKKIVFEKKNFLWKKKCVQNWLRNHIPWAYVELGWRLKVFPSSIFFCLELHYIKVCYSILCLKNSKFYVILYEWSETIIFLCLFCKTMFFNTMCHCLFSCGFKGRLNTLIILNVFLVRFDRHLFFKI